MIKILGMVLAVAGMIALVLSVLGVFGSISIGMSLSWALAIIGFIFFIAGIKILNAEKIPTRLIIKPV